MHIYVLELVSWPVLHPQKYDTCNLVMCDCVRTRNQIPIFANYRMLIT